MNEQGARKILGLSNRENPWKKMGLLKKNLARKKSFAENAPSQESKADFQEDYHQYKLAIEAVSEIAKPSYGLLIAGISLLAALGAGVSWWNIQEKPTEKKRQEIQKQQQLHNAQQRHQEAEIMRLLKQGEASLKKRKWETSQQAYQKVLDIDPHSISAQQGIAAIKQGLLTEKKQKIFYLLGNSQAALEAGDRDKAKKLAKAVLKESPNHPEALAKLKKIKEKRKAYDLQIQIQLLANLLDENRLPDAQKTLIQLKKLAPNDPKVLQLEQRTNEALADLQEKQKKARALYQQAQTLNKGQYSPEIIKLLEDAKQLDPKNPEIDAFYQTISNYTRTIHVPTDYTTITEAIAAASSRDRVVIAAGVYQEAIVIKKPIHLEGAPNGKTIISLPAEESTLLTLRPSAEGSKIDYIVFTHKGFDNSKDRASGVIIQARNVMLNTCEIKNIAGHGVAVIQGGSATISSCLITGCGWDGISVYGQSKGLRSRVTVLNSTSQKNINHGAEFWNGGEGDVRNSRMLANGLCGVLAMGKGAKVDIQGTRCSRNRDAGIYISALKEANISDNHCEKNLLSGIVVKGQGLALSLTHNIANENQEVGILVYRGVNFQQNQKNTTKSNKIRQTWLDATERKE